MSNVDTPPSNDKKIIEPVKKIVYQPEEKWYELKQNTYDIGEYLDLLDIKPYQTINITLKEGNFIWNKNYNMPVHAAIRLKGENYKNGGNQNKVTILINEKKGIIYEEKGYIEKTDFRINSRLYIPNNSFFSMTGIDIIEKINDSRPRYPNSSEIGVFNLGGEMGGNPVFSLTFGCFEISSSPFINVQGNCVKGRIILNYSHFKKNSFAKESEITIIDTDSGWNGRGSMAEVLKTLTDAQGCKFLTDKKSIIYNE